MSQYITTRPTRRVRVRGRAQPAQLGGLVDDYVGFFKLVAAYTTPTGIAAREIENHRLEEADKANDLKMAELKRQKLIAQHAAQTAAAVAGGGLAAPPPLTQAQLNLANFLPTEAERLDRKKNRTLMTVALGVGVTGAMGFIGYRAYKHYKSRKR